MTRRGLFRTLMAVLGAALVRKLPVEAPTPVVEASLPILPPPPPWPDLLEHDIRSNFLNTEALSVESLEAALQSWRGQAIQPTYLVLSQAGAEAYRRLQEVEDAALFNV